ncbi:hypothetical protein JTE90_028903 [Oedothorax gibbosus]|uniref:Regulatory protein zeste n=1 Tax=Oedothorax gibbosus TaxID=931172 RepID=A0AAV6UQA4_9ARAC|nr:hypothetical protein JTE90_028903 [Oedothorax gibbosus]
MSGVVKDLARTKVSPSQIAIMVEYMEKYPQLIRGCNYNADLTVEKKNALWEILKDSLNADETGATKCVPRWQKTWSDLKVHLRNKYRKKNKKSRKRPVFTELEEKLITMIGENSRKYGTIPVKKEDIDNTEIKITSVESQQEPASIENQTVASTSEQPPETETTMTTVESIQPSISCIQPQNSSNSLPVVQLPSNSSNQNQDSNKPLPQLLDTVYFYYKQPTLPTLLLTTQCNPQLDSGNSLNQDKLSTCTSMLSQNSSNSLSTAFDKSSVCNSNQQESNHTISAVQDKPSLSAGNNQESDVIMSDDQVKLSTCNDNTQQQDSHSTKSASPDQTTKSNVKESADNKGFFSCQMMSAKALQDIAKELGVKNDIERKRLELEERKVIAFELIAQRLQM